MCIYAYLIGHSGTLLDDVKLWPDFTFLASAHSNESGSCDFHIGVIADLEQDPATFKPAHCSCYRLYDYTL